MGVQDPLGRGKFGPQVLDWQNLFRGPPNINTYNIYKLWASWFQRRRFFFKVFPIIMGANEPPGAASLDLRGLTRGPLNIATY